MGTHLEPTYPRVLSSCLGQGTLSSMGSLRLKIASESHQQSPEHTSGKSWKGFTAQQFLHCPSRPCTHWSRLGGLGPGCSRDPLEQLLSHQHPPAMVPAASSTASAAAAPSIENVLPEYKFLPLSAFSIPSSSLPSFIFVRFRQPLAARGVWELASVFLPLVPQFPHRQTVQTIRNISANTQGRLCPRHWLGLE